MPDKASAVSRNVLLGTVPVLTPPPPSSAWLSTTATVAPQLAAVTAPAIPAGPPPRITTSNDRYSGNMCALLVLAAEVKHRSYAEPQILLCLVAAVLRQIHAGREPHGDAFADFHIEVTADQRGERRLIGDIFRHARDIAVS